MANHLRERKRRKAKRDSNNEEPFILLFLKVGACLLSVGWAATQVTLLFWSGTLTRYDGSARNDRGATFPLFQLDSEQLQNDVFAIRDKLKYNGKLQHHEEFYHEVSQLKKEFIARYGCENAARYLIHFGVTTFQPSEHIDYVDNTIFDAHDMNNIPSGLKHTAYRILIAKQQNRHFEIAFGGYSVTVGRGNYFNQSYPFILENLLTKPMKHLGIKLRVRNAAIGGVPSFPYGWCLDNFLGEDADVISWDYSMNEAGGAADGLEAYLHHGLSMNKQPMLIVKDTSTSIAQKRYDLIQRYVDIGALKDPIVLSIEDAIDNFLHVKEDLLPLGFREWRKFGAPKGSPGQTSHHPGVKEHELYGWLLTMHFLAVLELVAFLVSKGDDVLNELAKKHLPNEQDLLPAPIHGANIAPSELHSLFYGQSTNKQSSWKMNPVHCRTTYDPILKNNLNDILVSGVMSHLDIMLPRGPQLYNKGWVLDLGQGEKTAKRKLDRYGGLGYVDSKKAYYGIKSSGPLEMFLPCIGRDDILHKMQLPSREVLAHNCFQNVLICEVNDKHTTGKECNLNNDLSFVVGDAKSRNIQSVNATGAFYWGRNICIRIGIPEEAKLSSRNGSVGLYLTISVESTSVMIRTGPCSISHVVWEQSNK